MSTNGQLSSIPRQRVADARAVLTYSPELAQAVMHDEKPLRLAKLRDERPDLAELVGTEAMSLDDATAKAKADAEERSHDSSSPSHHR